MYIYIDKLLLCDCRSVDCFRLGWPMRADADFFCLPDGELRFDKSGVSNVLTLDNLSSHFE